MAFNKGQISNPSLMVKPSKELNRFIQNLSLKDDIPAGIKNIILKMKQKEDSDKKPKEVKYLINDQDIEFINSLNLKSTTELTKKAYGVDQEIKSTDRLLCLSDLHWLQSYITESNKNSEKKIYFHELFEGSNLVLPKNIEIPRNEELEKRCMKLKANQDNLAYNQMTKNVDSFRRRLPEDTIGYHIKQMNRHMIAVFQFIMSVAAGFAFGFIGVELIIGNLDFGFRLLLGIICSLVIALAELYFLAKRLNEDAPMEEYAAIRNKKKTE